MRWLESVRTGSHGVRYVLSLQLIEAFRQECYDSLGLGGTCSDTIVGWIETQREAVRTMRIILGRATKIWLHEPRRSSFPGLPRVRISDAQIAPRIDCIRIRPYMHHFDVEWQ